MLANVFDLDSTARCSASLVDCFARRVGSASSDRRRVSTARLGRYSQPVGSESASQESGWLHQPLYAAALRRDDLLCAWYVLSVSN